MTRLDEDSSLCREVVVGNLEKPVQLEIDAKGISFWIKGNRKRVYVTWMQIIQAGNTEQDVPSFLMDRPLELLRYQVSKALQRVQ